MGIASLLFPHPADLNCTLPFHTTTTTSNMPSQHQGWFARHCTPAPASGPLCPCAACYNNSGNSHNNNNTTTSAHAASAQLRYGSTSSNESATSLLRQEDDGSSLRSFTTTAHIEDATRQ